MKKLVAVTLLFSVALAVPAAAQLGFGAVPVFDASSWLELVSQLKQMNLEYLELGLIYGRVTDQYNQMLTNAKRIPVNMLSRYRASLSPWRYTTAGNTYGTTGGWIYSVNSGTGAYGGYATAVTPLRDYSSVWGSIPADQQDQLERNYATLEIKDGTAVNGIATIGTIRGNSSQVETAISGLESDSLSSDPNLNSEVGVLNKINAAELISIRNTQDSNKLLASVLEQQLAGEKARRDAEAQSINNQIAFDSQQATLIQQHMTGTTAALTGFNIP